MTAGRERSQDARSLGEVLGRLTQGRPFALGMALGRLAARWEGVVGERLASETAPIGLERGALTVAVSSAPWAAQVRFLGAEIAEKASLPGAPVTDVRVVVDPRRIRHRYGNSDGRMSKT